MKNKIVVTLWIILMTTLLTACGGTAEEAEAVAMEEGQDGGFAGEMSALHHKMMGVLLLENGDIAVTAEQANEMLPLWKLARSMNESSNVAVEELDALAEQISESLTDEQRAAIDEMEISGESVRELMQDLGIEFGGGQGEGRPEGFQRPEGGVPGSGPGGGAGGIGLSPDQIATMQAGREGFSRSGLNSNLLDALIALLEDKAGE